MKKGGFLAENEHDRQLNSGSVIKLDLSDTVGCLILIRNRKPDRKILNWRGCRAAKGVNDRCSACSG
jgi:hypothetical protein